MPPDVLGAIYRFEVRYGLRQPIFWICLVIFFLLTFFAVTTDAVQIGGAIGNVHRNAPYVIMQFLLVMSVIGVLVNTAFVAHAVHRDYDHRTHETFFSLPIKKRDYLLGRFLGASTVALLVYLGVALGVFVGSLMPWLEPERIGPFTPLPYLYSLLVLVLPNVFLTGAMFFGVAALTRSLHATYASVVVFYVGYFLAAAILGDVEYRQLAALLDPFGTGAFEVTTQYWTTAERNSALLPLGGALLQNRLLWTAVGTVLLGVTLARFRFAASAGPRRFRGWRRRRIEPSAAVPAGRQPSAVVMRHDARASWAGYRRHAWLELTAVMRSLPFLVIVALALFNFVGNAMFRDQLFGTEIWPVTYEMLDTVASAFTLFMGILLMFYSGELVWRERGLRSSEVFDALPVPNWVFWASKVTALAGVLVVLLAIAGVAGILFQTFQGYTRFELGLYVQGMFLEFVLPFGLTAILALCFQVVVNHKYVGFLMMVLFLISRVTLSALHFDHPLYQFAATPGAPYSDINGFGHGVTSRLGFGLYWTFVAGLLLVAVQLFWVRGTDSSWRGRWREAKRRFGPRPRVALGTLVVGFLVVGGWLFYNTNVVNAYVPSDERARRQAEFEKRYKQYESLPQPRITAVRSDVDIFPQERAVRIRGTYELENRTAEPIERLHVTLHPRLTERTIEIPGARLEQDDRERGYAIYRLEPPLAAGARTELRFEIGVDESGFVATEDNLRLVYNGTFFDSEEYFPHLGYSRSLELQDPNHRRKHGLSPVQRMPKLEDVAARRDTYVSREADWLRFETTVSTSPDQIALAPGYLEREWTEGGRRYFHYVMDAPILPFWAYLSARWEVRRDRWHDVAIEIYHHPTHAYNVERMIDAVKKSLDYFTAEFGPYQHRQVRILEFPRYERFAQSFPNTIPFSENIGFIARLKDPDAIDYVFYVTAHEVAHQWWAHQVIGGNVQGATVMSETLSQYSALMVMEREYGRDKMRRFLKYELDAYLRGRGGERIEELPLARVENQGYIHYRKGSLVMYALRDYIGEEALNAALARYVAATKFQEPPYTTTEELLSYLDQATPPQLKYLLDDLFRTITLFDNRATEASWQRREDGKYVVRLQLSSRKLRADGHGVETAATLDDWIDVGVFGARGKDDPPEGKVLLLEKRHLQGGEAVLELVVDQEPVRAGIDPFNKLIDRNPEDNLVRATIMLGHGS